MIDTIRPARLDDYGAIVEINNATWPDFPTSKEEMIDDDQHHERKFRFGRWVAVHNGEVVGVAQHDQVPVLYDPKTFWVEINVRPNHQREGVGGALFTRVLEELKPHHPAKLRAVTREDMEDGQRFFIERGFSEQHRASTAVLNVKSLNRIAIHAALVPMASQSIIIKSLADLSGDPARDHKAYDVHRTTRLDALLPEPLAEISFEQYKESLLDTPVVDPNGYFIAMHEGEFVGLCIVEIKGIEHVAQIVWVGVLPLFRGKGIGAALVATALTYAADHQFSHVEIALSSLNAPLIALSERLGFIRQPAIVHFVREMETEEKDVV